MIRNPRLAPLVGAGIALITAGTVFLAGAMTFSTGGAGTDVLRAVGPEGAEGRSLLLPVNPRSDSSDGSGEGTSAAGSSLVATAGAPADSLVAIPLDEDGAVNVDAASGTADAADTDSATARSLQPTSGRLSARGSVDGGGRTGTDVADDRKKRGDKSDKDRRGRDGSTAARSAAGRGAPSGHGRGKDQGRKGSNRSKAKSRPSHSSGKGGSKSKGHSAKPANSSQPSKPSKPAKPAQASHSNKPSHAGPPAHSNAGGSKGKGKGKRRA